MVRLSEQGETRDLLGQVQGNERSAHSRKRKSEMAKIKTLGFLGVRAAAARLNLTRQRVLVLIAADANLARMAAEGPRKA
jgi:hypothetical protein